MPGIITIATTPEPVALSTLDQVASELGITGECNDVLLETKILRRPAAQSRGHRTARVGMSSTLKKKLEKAS